MSLLLSNPLIQLKVPTRPRAKTTKNSFSISARLDNSQPREQELNLSVLRFTFGSYSLSYAYTIFVFKFQNRMPLFGCRDTWIRRVVSTEMDRLRLRFASCIEPLCFFQFSYVSTAG